jgi:hypothetical protein
MAICAQCRELADGLSLDKPREYLELALRLLNLVKDGAFVLGESTCSLEDLFKPQWPSDSVEHNLECLSCGRKFQLFADTYHGHAGWGQTGPPTKKQDSDLELEEESHLTVVSEQWPVGSES